MKNIQAWVRKNAIDEENRIREAAQRLRDQEALKNQPDETNVYSLDAAAKKSSI